MGDMNLKPLLEHSPIYNMVRSVYPLPHELYPYQIETVEELAPKTRAGYYLDVGTGKTLTSIVSCLYKLICGDVGTVVCIMPPILLTGWKRVLESIKGVSVTLYRGTPNKRRTMNLDADFVLMSYQVLKRDYEHLSTHYLGRSIVVLCDEAQAIKNVGSDNYRKVRDFSACNHLMLLTGTPLSTPMDAYAYVKQVSPDVYRSLGQFENVHVKSRDFFDKPSEWANLDLLKQNLELNSKRILIEDVRKDLPPIIYTDLRYELEPDHLKLYNRILSEQLLKFDNGEKLDLTNVSALFNAMQQVPVNAGYFSNGTVESTSLKLLDEVMDEIGDQKLVVFTKYKMTNRLLIDYCAKYGVVAVYGEISATRQQEAIDRFIADPTCRMILLQHTSGGAGIDGLQGVCSDVLFLEMPYTAAAFTQAVARVYRTGQTRTVRVRVGVAVKTVQEYLLTMVKDKDNLVNLCIRGKKSLADALAGNV